MKFSHDSSYLYKFDSDTFQVEYDFTSDLGAGDTLASAVVTCTDANGNSTTTAMISGTTVVTPDVYFTIDAGTVGMLYSIKIVATSANSYIYTGLLTCEVFGDITLNTKLGDSSANSYATLKEINDYIMNKYGHLNSWDTLTIEGKKRLAIQAAIDINTINFVGNKYYSSQAMAFPRSNHTIITGNCATPFSINSFLNSNLYSTTYGQYPENYWKYGSCHITEGTPVYDTRLIATSIATNGQIVVSPDFSATPNSSTEFIIFTPLDPAIKHAQCEQILYLLQTSSMESLRNYKTLGAQEVEIGDVRVAFGFTSKSRDSVVISSGAKRFLSKYIDRSYRVLRA